MRPYITDEERCVGCGTCHDVCPEEPNVFEIEMVSKVVHPEACTECNDCVLNCPVGIIELR